MRVASISGWGQPQDALKAVVPEAMPIRYAQHTEISAALSDIAQQARGHDLIVGWSLGGQLALRAIAEGRMHPRFLVLIGAAYQFVATPQMKLGMPRDTYEKFRENYAKNPARTLHKGWELIVHGDTHADTVRGYLAQQDRDAVLHTNWLRWFELLDGFSFATMTLDNVPPTLLIHGDHDAVVAHAQAQRLERALPHARLETIKGAGHAPHWHDNDKIRQLIMEHAHV